ncbi:MAG: hypothetical protein ACTS5A_02180 [Candidatus Hodgkinia cicadicola]
MFKSEMLERRLLRWTSLNFISLAQQTPFRFDGVFDGIAIEWRLIGWNALAMEIAFGGLCS